MSAIYYIGHYDLKDEPRSVSPAAVTMMDYVSEVIQREGFQCNILSCASDVASHIEKKVVLNDGRKVVFKPCFGKVAKLIFQNGCIMHINVKSHYFNSLTTI